MEKSIEDYRRELLDMAARGNAGARELFAEDSEVETTPPQMSSPPTLPQEMEPQPEPSRPAPPQIQPVPPQRPTPSRPIEPEPTPQRPTPQRPTPQRPTPQRPTPSRPESPRPTPPRPTPPQMAPTPSRPIPPMNQPNLTASGTLVVVLTHSKGLFPVPNARVCVSDANGNSIGCKQTDASGRTDEWRLAAPPKANSTSPGASASDVSSFYNIRIDAQGYVPVIIESVPIFDGVRTLQPLDMFFAGAAPSTAPEVIKFNNSYTL